jgi:hypothetical protein
VLNKVEINMAVRMASSHLSKVTEEEADILLRAAKAILDIEATHYLISWIGPLPTSGPVRE